MFAVPPNQNPFPQKKILTSSKAFHQHRTAISVISPANVPGRNNWPRNFHQQKWLKMETFEGIGIIGIPEYDMWTDYEKLLDPCLG